MSNIYASIIILMISLSLQQPNNLRAAAKNNIDKLNFLSEDQKNLFIEKLQGKYPLDPSEWNKEKIQNKFGESIRTFVKNKVDELVSPSQRKELNEMIESELSMIQKNGYNAKDQEKIVDKLLKSKLFEEIVELASNYDGRP